MVRQVQNEHFYHINRLSHYSPYQLMTVGQTFEVGNEESPFFSYYRQYIRQYPAVQQPENITVQLSAMEALKRVRNGQAFFPNFPQMAFEIAQHFMLLARELLWETIRASEFSDRPSRQKAMWLIQDDIRAITEWRSRLGHTENTTQCQLVEVSATGCVHDCDAAFLLDESEFLNETERKARAYWRGDIVSEGSQPETLFNGNISVVRIVDIGSPEFGCVVNHSRGSTEGG